MGRCELAITHIFFADDSILFGKTTMKGKTSIKSVVNEYENISRQLVNFKKLLIYFSKNVQDDLKEQIGGFLGVRISNNLKKYLGLPTMVWRRKKGCIHRTKRKNYSKIEELECVICHLVVKIFY